MLALPISMIVALVLGFLFVRTLLAGGYPKLFAALLFVCALQGVVVSLIQYYGVAALLALQPVTATTIPPLAWLAFLTSAVRPLDERRDLLHLAAPAFTAFCVAFAPLALDVVVSGIFVGYGVAILVTLRRSAGDLPLMRLESGRIPGLIWRAIALALIVSAIGDGLIAVVLAYDFGLLRPWILSIFSSIALLSIGLLAVSNDLIGGAEPEPTPDDAAPPPAVDSAEDEALMQRLDRLVREDQLYLDSDLTLARLARRLHVPIKRLSATINRRTGENVSRFINNYRIAHACDRLKAGDSVTTAMLASGFNTKSNFNREFGRVTGKAPRDWKAPAAV
jgi:AraC-like DNA-binding protein